MTSLFDRNDVWYCPVNTPASALRFPQAQACGIFEEHGMGDGVLVASPLMLSGVAGTGTSAKLPAAPKLGSRLS